MVPEAAGPSISLRDFLLALFADLACDHRYAPSFAGNHREIHRFFWRLSREARFHDFVAEALFDTNGSYPHAARIDELLREFQLSGVLSRPNPTYRYHDIALTTDSYAAQLRERLGEQQREAFTLALARFKEELGRSRKTSPGGK